MNLLKNDGLRIPAVCIEKRKTIPKRNAYRKFTGAKNTAIGSIRWRCFYTVCRLLRTSCGKFGTTAAIPAAGVLYSLTFRRPIL